MPIYYGCTRIFDYFPSEAMVCIDIRDPLEAIQRVQEAISNDLWRRNLEAIAYARELVLQRYQLFPYVSQEIQRHEGEDCAAAHRHQLVTVPCRPRLPLTVGERLHQLARRYVPPRTKRALKRLARLLGG